MKALRLYYVAVLTLSWIACVLLEFAFPGPERAAQALTLTGAAFWARPLATEGLSTGTRSIETVLAIMAAASLATILVLAAALDGIGVRRAVWVRSVLASSLLGLAWPAWKLFCDMCQGYSVPTAAGFLGLNDHFFAYALFCASTGLLLGSVMAIILGGIERLTKTPC